MEISLRHFLQTGSLGPVHFGMSAEQVFDLFGSPDDVDTTDPKAWGKQWHYGTFHFGFGEEASQKEGLTSIQWTSHFGEACVPSPWKIIDWGITADM